MSGQPATAEQVGGDHYKRFAIQPVEFIHANKLGFLEGCVIKRVMRHRNKGGREDLEKAIHELRLLIELEYGEDKGEPVYDAHGNIVARSYARGQYIGRLEGLTEGEIRPLCSWKQRRDGSWRTGCGVKVVQIPNDSPAIGEHDKCPHCGETAIALPYFPDNDTDKP